MNKTYKTMIITCSITFILSILWGLVGSMYISVISAILQLSFLVSILMNIMLLVASMFQSYKHERLFQQMLQHIVWTISIGVSIFLSIIFLQFFANSTTVQDLTYTFQYFHFGKAFIFLLLLIFMEFLFSICLWYAVASLLRNLKKYPRVCITLSSTILFIGVNVILGFILPSLSIGPINYNALAMAYAISNVVYQIVVTYGIGLSVICITCITFVLKRSK